MNEPWYSWRVGDPETERVEAEEEFLEQIRDLLRDLLTKKAVSQSLAARRMGRPASNICTALAGKNITLRTLAGIAWSCNTRVQVTFEDAHDDQ